ncbi:type VI secretion system baseplate subunit TssF [Paraburkholderia dipogonis]|uniref:Type VI secretion system baseplate subunit TssF n=1 Tax=Paraburkholderia dipogonis TaxID=1211383 RepID=A0A4Y8N7G3_9BURK|nr:type VI secretion system baseplate subunit TssF [Paraburkholderia dipogonis]TFE45621.1 type VI secretion system baseplate subunit TssF [Paraburkholderia dipogonis]
MDPRLLDYYSRELLYIRELAMEFAAAHPKIARRLGMHAGEIGDPYVERLLQSSALVTARAQIRLDDAFPEFTLPLLQTVYPNYTCPTPSIAVARFFPLAQGKHAVNGTVVPRGTAFPSRIPDGEVTACEFRSSQDVTLFPLEIVQARLTGIPPDIPMLDRYVPAGRTAHGALRLRLRTTNGASIANLAGLDRLPVYLSGDETTASHLFELIHAAGLASVTGVPGEFATGTLHAVTRGAVVHEALEPEQSLLPAVPRKFHGHNLLQEYFACPARFWFFTLTGLAKGLASIAGNEAEIVLLLERPAHRLAETVDASHFALFCTPVINLFPRRTDRLDLDPDRQSHRLLPVPAASSDYAVHSVQAAWGQVSEASEALRFYPLHASVGESTSRGARYFTIRRELNRSEEDDRHYGTRRPFTETRTFISLVDRDERPNTEGIHYLSLEALLTNRDLPCLIPCDGRRDLFPHKSIPAESVGLVRAPTMPRPPLASGERAWQLYGQLNLGYMTFDEPPDRPATGDALRRLLRLYLSEDTAVLRRQVEALTSATATPVNRRLPPHFPQPFGRGIECTLTFDESGFDGMSPYTLGLVLERYVARHVSERSFTTTVLCSTQRGRITHWPPRAGTRGAA